jgi:hypothetical protein
LCNFRPSHRGMSIRRIGVRRSDKPDAADRSACRQDRSCCGSRNALGVSGEIHGNAGTTTATRQPRISAERCGVVRHDRRYGQRRSCLRSSTSHKEARTEADDALGDATRPCRATCPSNEIPPADSLHKLILSACGFPIWKRNHSKCSLVILTSFLVLKFRRSP